MTQGFRICHCFRFRIFRQSVSLSVCQSFKWPQTTTLESWFSKLSEEIKSLWTAFGFLHMKPKPDRFFFNKKKKTLSEKERLLLCLENIYLTFFSVFCLFCSFVHLLFVNSIKLVSFRRCVCGLLNRGHNTGATNSIPFQFIPLGLTVLSGFSDLISP